MTGIRLDEMSEVIFRMHRLIIDQISQEAEALKRCSQRKSTALDELKQSILQKAFTGQLTAKSPELEAVP